MKRDQKQNNKGFSLVELIVVIAIMAVLMGVLAPTLIGNVEKSRESTDLQNLDSIKGAVTTCMSEEGVYKEVMQKAETSGPIAISLGACNKVSIDNISGDDYPNLKAELTATLTESITMKSTAASSKNQVYIVIAKNGSVSALIASSETNAKAYTAAECSKTKDEDGNKRKLISGNAASEPASK